MKFSLESMNELAIIKGEMKPEMITALRRSITEDNLEVGNVSLGIFGTIFDKADDKYALAFKKKCGLRMMDNNVMSQIEKEWKDNSELGFDCALYLGNFTTLEDLYSAYDVEETKVEPSISDEVIREYVSKLSYEEKERLGLISITEKIVEKEKKVPSAELFIKELGEMIRERNVEKV